LSRQIPVTVWLLQHDNSADVFSKIGEHLDGLVWHCGAQPPKSLGSLQIVDVQYPEHRPILSNNVGIHRLMALDWFDPSILPDITINLYDHSGLMSDAYSAVGRSSHYHEGPEYAIIRPALLTRRGSTNHFDHVKRIMISLGGADPARRSLEAVKILQPYLKADMEVLLILGPLVPDDYDRELRATVPNEVIIIRNPSNYDDLLSSADLVICSGGGTLLETLAVGRPAVVLPQTPHEEVHARSHVNAGACVFSCDLPLVLSDPLLRRSLAKAAIRRVDGEGVRRIADAALSLLKSGKNFS